MTFEMLDQLFSSTDINLKKQRNNSNLVIFYDILIKINVNIISIFDIAVPMSPFLIFFLKTPFTWSHHFAFMFEPRFPEKTENTLLLQK